MRFNDYIASGDVKRGAVDKGLAKSLLEMSKLRIEKLTVLNVADENAFEIVERCYNVLKELADALMVIDGYKSYSHEAVVEFLREFYIKELGIVRIEQLNRYRILRNDIFYRGRTMSMQDSEQAIKDMNAISAMLIELLRKKGVV